MPLCVDVEHRVELFFCCVDDRFAQHLARCVDGDVDSTELLLRCRKRRGDIANLCEITLNGERLAARSVDVGDGLVGIFLRGRAVIVNANPGAFSCEYVAEEAAKILCAASDENGFS